MIGHVGLVCNISMVESGEPVAELQQDERLNQMDIPGKFGPERPHVEEYLFSEYCK